MSREKYEGVGFMTQSTHSRPKTSYISRNKTNLQELMLDPELNSINKIKVYKQELKKLELEYQDKLTRLNESKKSIGRQYRDSQKKKVQFVNLYENRKLRLYEQRLLEEKSSQDNEYKKLTRERAKTIKLNNEIRSLLVKNELEETNSALTTKNKLDKHVRPHPLSAPGRSCTATARRSWRPRRRATRGSGAASTSCRAGRGRSARCR